MVHLFFFFFFPFLVIENEKVLQALIAENSEMKTKLKDLGTPPRYLKKSTQGDGFFFGVVFLVFLGFFFL